MAKRRGFKKVALPLPRYPNSVAVFAGATTASTIDGLMDDVTVYSGVKILQAFEAIYNQGRKDGARDLFIQIDGRLDEIKKLVPHKNPGRGKKPKAASEGNARRKRRKAARGKKRNKR